MFIAGTTVPGERTPTRRQIISGGAIAAVALAMRPASVMAESGSEVSHQAEAIHQERLFKANPQHVYEALTVSEQFDKVTQLSGVMQAAVMAKMHKPTKISREPGGPFSLFGGFIVGRQIELIPHRLIVQAWRAGSWEPGVYSVITFVLIGQGEATKLVFDHAGFPKGQGEHLAAGWQGNYWEPLAKYLA
jgi:activator of HSP90 ATPase